MSLFKQASIVFLEHPENRSKTCWKFSKISMIEIDQQIQVEPS